MNDERDLLERELRRFEPQPGLIDRVYRRCDRKQRNRRIAAAVVGLSVALVTLASLVRTFRTVEGPADELTPAPSPTGIFADVAGWIAYGNDRVKQGPLGIFAVDPARPNDPEARIQLSERPGEPLAWSSDGSKLLIWREHRLEGPAASFWTGLFVLNADGTETRLVIHKPGASSIYPGGSFSPDGSGVVFATHTGGIYRVDADGGTPRLLKRSTDYLSNPTFSPDGTKIAYFSFQDVTGHSLRVINADGTGDRLLLDSQAVNCLRPVTIRPTWSPEGTRIAFTDCDGYGIRVVGADGSGLSTMIDNGKNPYLSPDWSRIAFKALSRLVIANADGTPVQVFQYPSGAGPWNPLLLSAPGKGNPTGSGLAIPWVYAIALVVLVGVLIGSRRVRDKLAAKHADQSNDVAS
jgi:hypothetical protein